MNELMVTAILANLKYPITTLQNSVVKTLGLKTKPILVSDMTHYLTNQLRSELEDVHKRSTEHLSTNKTVEGEVHG